MVVELREYIARLRLGSRNTLVALQAPTNGNRHLVVGIGVLTKLRNQMRLATRADKGLAHLEDRCAYCESASDVDDLLVSTFEYVRLVDFGLASCDVPSRSSRTRPQPSSPNRLWHFQMNLP